MTLVRRILVEKRAIVLPLIALALANAAVYFFVRPSLERRGEASRRRAMAIGAELASAVKAETTMKAAVESQAKAREDLARFEERVLPADQASARRLLYLRVAEMADDSNLVFDRRTLAETSEPDTTLVRLDMSLQLEGTYADVRRFLHAVESAKEFLVVRNLGLGESPEGEGFVRLSVTVSTFFKGPDGA